MIEYRNGSVTVSLDGGLERFVRRLLDSTQSELVRQIRRAADDVARAARADWYGPQGVTRETGRSGDIQVRELVDAARGEIRISVGSTDQRMAGIRPLPVYVHRPGPTSTVLRVVSPRKYFAAPTVMRGPWRVVGGRRAPQLFVPNPAASDGKFLLQTLVKGPMRARVKAISIAAAKGIGERMRRAG
jgi:hypothetical protein